MIYLELGDGKKLLILEHGNLNHLRAGGSVVSPTGAVCLTATHDAVWLGEQLKAAATAGVLNHDTLTALIIESRKRPIVTDRHYHGYSEILRDGQLAPEAN